MLGPYLDEIELLLFESLSADSLPSKTVIAELSHLARDYNLTYNVHLPTDVSISDPKLEKQRLAVDTILNVGELLAPLSPTAFSLHIPYSKKSFSENAVKSWQSCVFRNLEKILAGGIPAESIVVETLDYRFDLLDGVIADLNLSVCLDLGHLLVHGYHLNALFNKYADRTSMIHLHGVKNGHDHLALNKLSDESMEPVLEILRQFTGSVSLEVFSFDDLKTSLQFLENHWGKSKMQ
jgi:sugar phosphate isomerase/epimerase